MKWNLDCFFPGGSASPQFADFLANLENDISSLHAHISSPNTLTVDHILNIQEIDIRFQEADSFIHCLCAQNTKDEEAVRLKGRLEECKAAYHAVSDAISSALAEMADDAFDIFISDKRLALIAYPLQEKRRLARDKLSQKEEVIANELSIDGFHGWYQMYQACLNQMKIRFQVGEKWKNLSIGQAYNYLTHPNRLIRQKLFNKWEQVFFNQKELFAQVLNHLAGFRLKVYQKRGWTSILKQPLELNHLSEMTLKTMWDVVDANKAPFVQFLKAKAEIFGVKALSWHDVTAPLAKDHTDIPYRQGQKWIVDEVKRLSPSMADFAKMTFEQNWNEVEDRPGKTPGGFCTPFPLSRQSRIFMTYSNTSENLTTLIHELGHAYHNYVMCDLPAIAQQYPMCLAETASIFAEHILSGALLERAKTTKDRLSILGDRVQRSVLFFMNIHCRYLFELAFYKERDEGFVSAKRLSTMMEEAQKKAFSGALQEYHPHFWASKEHFYLTDMPGYHFPYTFGYLFSLGLYAKCQSNPSTFDEIYRALLRDTGRMSVEDLAKLHLGVDLTAPDFWQSAMNIAIKDAHQFMALFKNCG